MATSEKSFWAFQNDALNTRGDKHDMMWYEILRPSLVSALKMAVKMATYGVERGWGLVILSWDRAESVNWITWFNVYFEKLKSYKMRYCILEF